MDSDSAVRLFLKLGVRIDGLSRREFTEEYFQLAWRYHPDRNGGQGSDLMSSINAARTYLEQFYHWRPDDGGDGHRQH